MFPIIFSTIQWQQWKVTKPSEPVMTMMGLEANNEPHPKRIERLPEIMAHSNSDCEESSEYKECRKELSESEHEG